MYRIIFIAIACCGIGCGTTNSPARQVGGAQRDEAFEIKLALLVDYLRTASDSVVFVSDDQDPGGRLLAAANDRRLKSSRAMAWREGLVVDTDTGKNAVLLEMERLQISGETATAVRSAVRGNQGATIQAMQLRKVSGRWHVEGVIRTIYS